MTDANKIAKKITAVAVVKQAPVEVTAPPEMVLEKLTEHVSRPEVLQGRTYKLKPVVLDHAMYITINDIVLNEGTEHETRQPFEIFINSKEMDSYQWIVMITRLISAIFRKGGNPMFLLEEMKSVFDPNGGYYSRKQRMPSLVAEIGFVIEDHFKWLGLIKPEELAPEVKQFIEAKTADYVAAGGSLSNATTCSACGEKAVIILDKCPTCTSCGASKCG